MGMQCPPSPGPGKKGIKPKGLVAAASITSQTPIPSLSHMMAISLTRPMLTARKVFSSISLGIPRIDPLGRKSQVKVFSHLKPRGPKFRQQDFVCRSGIGCALQRYEHILVKALPDFGRCVGDVLNVRIVSLSKRRGHADADGVYLPQYTVV